MSQCLGKWIKIYDKRQEFKSKMMQVFRKFDLEDKESAFKQWKRGAYFMKTCELIYIYRYQDQEENTIQRCFFEWQRLLRH